MVGGSGDLAAFVLRVGWTVRGGRGKKVVAKDWYIFSGWGHFRVCIRDMCG